MQNPIAVYTVGSATVVGQVSEASRSSNKVLIRYRPYVDSLLCALSVEFDSPEEAELTLQELQQQLITNCNSG